MPPVADLGDGADHAEVADAVQSGLVPRRPGGAGQQQQCRAGADQGTGEGTHVSSPRRAKAAVRCCTYAAEQG